MGVRIGTNLMARPSNASTLFRTGAIFAEKYLMQDQAIRYQVRRSTMLYSLRLCGKVIVLPRFPILVDFTVQAITLCINERYEPRHYDPVPNIGYTCGYSRFHFSEPFVVVIPGSRSCFRSRRAIKTDNRRNQAWHDLGKPYI
jgi:hypothetical protein